MKLQLWLVEIQKLGKKWNTLANVAASLKIATELPSEFLFRIILLYSSSFTCGICIKSSHG